MATISIDTNNDGIEDLSIDHEARDTDGDGRVDRTRTRVRRDTDGDGKDDVTVTVDRTDKDGDGNAEETVVTQETVYKDETHGFDGKGTTTTTRRDNDDDGDVDEGDQRHDTEADGDRDGQIDTRRWVHKHDHDGDGDYDSRYGGTTRDNPDGSTYDRSWTDGDNDGNPESDTFRDGGKPRDTDGDGKPDTRDEHTVTETDEDSDGVIDDRTFTDETVPYPGHGFVPLPSPGAMAEPDAETGAGEVRIVGELLPPLPADLETGPADLETGPVVVEPMPVSYAVEPPLVDSLSEAPVSFELADSLEASALVPAEVAPLALDEPVLALAEPAWMATELSAETGGFELLG